MPRTKKPKLTEIEAEQAEWRKRQQAARKAILSDLKKNIVPRLTKLGIARVQVDYSGYGDSGAIDFVDYFDAAGKAVSPASEEPALDADMERITEEFLPDGYENSDGGQGKLIIDIPTRCITLEHQDNYVQHHDTTKEIPF